MNEKSSDKLERVKLHLADTKAREFYSIQRIDLLVISISGAGIYLVFETMKFMHQEKLLLNRDLLAWGGGLFVFAILLNFASQWFGYYTNRHEACWAQYEHKKEASTQSKLDKKEDEKQLHHSTCADRHGWWTRTCNGAATLAMLAAVVLLVIFNLTSFPVV